LDQDTKNSLAACEQAGRVFRLEHPSSTLKEARAEASRCWSEDMDRLAFQAGWVLMDTELLRAETCAATKLFSNPASARGRAGQGRAGQGRAGLVPICGRRARIPQNTGLS
jgi:hypothetical protein